MFKEKLEKILDDQYHDRVYNDHSYAIKDILSLIADELPKEMYDPTKVCQPEYPDDYKQGKVAGFNKCLREVKTKLGVV